MSNLGRYIPSFNSGRRGEINNSYKNLCQVEASIRVSYYLIPPHWVGYGYTKPTETLGDT